MIFTVIGELKGYGLGNVIGDVQFSIHTRVALTCSNSELGGER